MPFIPHTDDETAAMLQAIGVDSVDALFDEIAPALRSQVSDSVPPRLSEMEISRLMNERAEQDGRPKCFAGAGAYDHHVPAAVWEIATRGEFYTAYTPYQAEASQGTLQLLYEYQTMMADLNAMEVSNASLYDGASALAEAVLMAVRLNRKDRNRRILVPRTLHPNYRRTLKAIVSQQGIVIDEIDFDTESGMLDPAGLEQQEAGFTALVIAQPNFFGQLEQIDELTDRAHARGAMVIAVVNPVSLAVLKAPGEWGSDGADISCGEGQPLGIPLSSGGPYYGFLCTRQKFIRQMPGRLIGRTVDLDGRPGYTLTLQAREQHIRRSKATSNICTNQGLMVTASTIYMALMGAAGLSQVAEACFANTHTLVERIETLPAARRVFSGDYFHEAVVRIDAPVDSVLRAMQAQNILAGYPLAQDYPELGDSFLLCVTETRSRQDMDQYFTHLQRILDKQAQIKCPIQPKI